MATLSDPGPQNDLSQDQDKEVELIAARAARCFTDDASDALLHHLPGLDSRLESTRRHDHAQVECIRAEPAVVAVGAT